MVLKSWIGGRGVDLHLMKKKNMGRIEFGREWIWTSFGSRSHWFLAILVRRRWVGGGGVAAACIGGEEREMQCCWY